MKIHMKKTPKKRQLKGRKRQGGEIKAPPMVALETRTGKGILCVQSKGREFDG